MRKVLVLLLCVAVVSTLAVSIFAKAATAPKPIKLTMFSADNNINYDNFQSPVAKMIQQKTGVTLDIEFAVGDSDQKIGLMAASGDYPDLIFAKNGFQTLYDAGALVKLDSYITKYGANIRKLYGDNLKRLRYSLKDTSIYYLGCGGVNETKFEPSGGFELQHAVVKELGFPKMKTVEDFENALKAYYAKHPTIDGLPTIPLSLIGSEWRWLITVTNPACYATGGPDDGDFYVDPQTLNVTLHNRRPVEKKYYKWLNHMYNAGLLDPESFTQTFDLYKSKIASGRVLGLIDASWEYGEANTALGTAGKFERQYGMYPVTLNENIKYRDFQDSGYLGGWGLSITTACKDPVRAFQFLDWMASDEAQILTHWGPEGVLWKKVNGKRVLIQDAFNKWKDNPAEQRRTGIGAYTYPYPEYGRGVKDKNGEYYQPVFPETIASKYSPIEKEVLAGYKAKMWRDLYPQANEFPVKTWGALWLYGGTKPDDVAKVDEYGITMKHIANIVMAKPEQFEAEWSSYMKDLTDNGIEKLEDWYTEQIQEKLKLWK